MQLFKDIESHSIWHGKVQAAMFNYSWQTVSHSRVRVEAQRQGIGQCLPQVQCGCRQPAITKLISFLKFEKCTDSRGFTLNLSSLAHWRLGLHLKKTQHFKPEMMIFDRLYPEIPKSTWRYIQTASAVISSPPLAQPCARWPQAFPCPVHGVGTVVPPHKDKNLRARLAKHITKRIQNGEVDHLCFEAHTSAGRSPISNLKISWYQNQPTSGWFCGLVKGGIFVMLGPQ